MPAAAPPPPDDTLPAPRANPVLLGHDAAEVALLRAWRSGRMPHAWLLAGPRGVGKATLAFRLARFVLSEGAAESEGQGGLFGGPAGPPPDTLAVDPANPVFRRAASGGHPDLFTLETGMIHPDTKKPTAEIIAPHVRRVNEQLRLTPVEGGWRVAVIDAAEDMNSTAANAFLKLLEEPPARALILLISHAPGRLLPTIRSRCRLLTLPPLSDARVGELLARFRPDLPPEERDTLIRLGEGSVGRALELVDRDGAQLYRDVLALLTRLPRLDVQALHAFAETMARSGEDAAASFRTVIELLSGWVSRLVKQSATGATQPGWEDEADLLGRLANSGPAPWLAASEKVRRLGSATEGLNLDRKQALIAAFTAIETASQAA